MKSSKSPSSELLIGCEFEGQKLKQLDRGAVTRSTGQAGIDSDQRSVKFLSKRDIRCIVRREIVTHLPDSAHQRPVGIKIYSQPQEIYDGLFRAPIRDLIAVHHSPQDLHYFKVQQVGSMQGLIARVDPLLDSLTRPCPE
jgi:hypothetical protein